MCASLAPAAVLAQVPVPDSTRPRPPVAQPGDSAPDPLSLNLRTRIETKLERNQNERCTAGQALVAFTNCRGGFQPIFGVEFNILSTGTLAERFNVNLDFDSEREFDASNNISLYYQGRVWAKKAESAPLPTAPPPPSPMRAGAPG